MMHRSHFLPCLTLGLVAPAPSAHALQVPLPNARVVALEGQLVPALGPGITIDQLGGDGGLSAVAPAIGPDGRMIFHVVLAGPSVVDADDVAFLRDEPPGLEVVVRAGFAPPELGGIPLSGFPLDAFVQAPDASGGAVHFLATFSGDGDFPPPDPDAVAYWSERDGAIEKVLGIGDDLSGAPGGTVDTLLSGVPTARADGALLYAVRTVLLGVERDQLLLHARGADPVSLLASGLPAPGFPAGVTIGAHPDSVGSMAIQRLVVRPHEARVLLWSNLSGDGVDEFHDAVLYSIAPEGGFTVLAREGDPAPGLSGAHYGGGNGDLPFLQLALAEDRAAWSSIVMGGVAGTRDEAIFTDRSGTIELVVTTDSHCATDSNVGDQVPGQPVGTTFGNVLSLAFDGARVAFSSPISQGEGVPSCLNQRVGVFLDAGPGIETVALEGEQVPGADPGTTFVTLGPPVFTRAGSLVFRATVAGPGIGPQNDQWLLALAPEGALRAVLRTGDLVDVAGDGSDLRAIAGFTRGVGLGDGGELPFEVAFQGGGQGMMVVDLADAPPNPGTPTCPGDGSAAACGCGNESPAGLGAGCLNGLGLGAQLVASGEASLSDDTLGLAVQGVPAQPGLFFQGDVAIAAGAGLTFGDGIRCCGQSVVRLELVTPSPPEPAVAELGLRVTKAVPPGSLLPGDSRCYQYWYRDPSGSPCASGFNLSNGLTVTWSR